MSIFEQKWETRKHIHDLKKNTHSVGYIKRNQTYSFEAHMTLWLCTAVNSESVSPESDQSYSRETYLSLTTIMWYI